MKDLSKKVHEQVKKLDGGKLSVEELESLTDSARELYERLLIVKYKAYEKFGEPEASTEEIEEVQEVVEAPKEEVPEKVEEEQPSIDFSAMSEEEQPSFDFSASVEEEVKEEVEETVVEEPPVEEEEEEHEPFPVDADIKNEAPVAEETESTDTFPEDAEIKNSKEDIFKDSHIEKHEPEDQNSLNQKLGDGAEDELSLRKKLQGTPVSDLKSEISIAKKFEYITFMFDGKNEIYEEAINSLNSCTDGEEAKNKLNEYSTKYNWDLENKSIMKFVELVERRYL